MALTDAALSAPAVYPSTLIFADFADLPLRYAFAPFSLLVPTGLADADVNCEGFTFTAIDSQVLSISSIAHEDGGTQTLIITLRATPDDVELLAAIENPALYVGRMVRIWMVVHDGAGAVAQISPSQGYKGFMGVPTQTVDPSTGTMQVVMEVENWQAILGRAPSRTYLTQKLYDALDESANVSIGGGRAFPSGIGGGAGSGMDYMQYVSGR